MTLKEVAQICVLIRKTTFAWKNESDDGFEEIVNAWHECLQDEPYEMARKAAADYIKANNYPPTVADVYKPYKEWKERQHELMIEYGNVYLTAISYYPCYEDTSEVRAEFDRIAGNSVSKAKVPNTRLLDFVRNREKSGEEIPPLIEWLKGMDSIE